MLKDHLAYRMEKHQRRAGEEGEKLTVTQAVEQYGLTRRGYDPSKSDAGKGKSGDLRGTDHQHQYAQKTYFKHIPETGNTQSCTTV